MSEIIIGAFIAHFAIHIWRCRNEKVTGLDNKNNTLADK